VGESPAQMSDTTPEAEKLWRELWAAQPPERRLECALKMFDTAKAIVLSSFPPNLTERERKKTLIERFYPELAPAFKAYIFERL
jgi:hypothetical protein